MQTAVSLEVCRIVFRLPDAQERVAKEAEVVFGTQHFPHCVVDVALADPARSHEAGQLPGIQFVGHAHVHAGQDGELCSFGIVARHAVDPQFGDGTVITDRHALEAPFLAQQILQQPLVGRGRHAVDGIERDHHATGTRIDRRAVRREVVVEHAHGAHVDHVVVASAFDCPVEREVLH